MSTNELRERLIEKIQQTDNKYILKEVSILFDIENDETEIYKLTNDQKREINAAQLQIKDGKFFSNDEVDKEIDEWLKK